jgi:hypothetical protein
MRCRTHSVRAHLDRLEARDVPAANLTVTFSAVTHTLTVVGDANADDVTVVGDAASPTHFTLKSSGTINGLPSPFSTPAGVKNLAFKMLGGDATVTFDPTVPITVQGNVTFTGGTGANFVTATDLTVDRNLSVTNAAHAGGADFVQLIDFSAGGNVTVRNAGGDSLTHIERNTAGISTIKGSLTITNGTGADGVGLSDTNVDGNVTVKNGHGNPVSGSAGQFIFDSVYNAFRSVIGGNLTVSYLDGSAGGDDILLDTEVLGNVTLNHGTAGFATQLDEDFTKLPVLIHGSLTITGTGANSVGFGTGAGDVAGVVVDMGFTLTSGGGSAETLGFKNFEVGGSTSITLGDGGNTVNIDDSYFGGKFTLVSGAGADTVNIEPTGGTTPATEFKKAVLIDLGIGNNTTYLASNGITPADAGQEVVIWSTFEIEGAANYGYTFGQVLFPNGGSVIRK